MAQPLAELEGAELAIPGGAAAAPILKGLNWQIWPGAHCALAGANGAGKTTLLKALHGDLWASKGRIAWQYAGRMEESPIIGRRVAGLVSPRIQARCQRQGWRVTAAEILAGAESDAPLAFGHAPDAAREARIQELMRALGAEQWLELAIPEMSQGQLRLALLARELLRAPRLLLLDEWSEGLDDMHRRLCLARLEQAAEATTMIFAAHDEASVPAWVAARRIVADGALGAELPRTAARGARPRARSHAPAAAPAAECGASGAPAAGPAIEAGARPILELERVSVCIAGKRVLHDINWRLSEGEHWRISGPNGAGKSTFLRLLAGDEFIHSGGRMRLWLANGGLCPDLAERRRQVSLVSDLGEATYGYDLSAIDYVLSGIENSVGIYRRHSAGERAWAAALLREFFALEWRELAGARISQLSTGQLRRLSIARGLAARPRVLLLDEPFTGLDERSRELLNDMLARIMDGGRDGAGPRLVLVSHSGQLPRPCKEARMEAGKLAWQGPAGSAIR